LEVLLATAELLAKEIGLEKKGGAQLAEETVHEHAQ